MNQTKRREVVREEFPGEMHRGTPNSLYATSGRFEGEINLQWDAVENARAYVIQLNAGARNKWTQVDIVDEPYYNMSGLQREKKYCFRVAAVFSEKQGEWSEPIVKRVP